MKFSESFIATLRQKVPLSTHVAKHMRLLRKGRLLMGLCPFHGEKTPSFSLNETRGTYHCFGCGARGDVIDFVRQHQRVSFGEAVIILANAVGMELPKDTSESALAMHAQRDLYRVMEAACQWYQKNLQENPVALDYLKKRGLTPEDIKRFRLGWAPPQGWLRQGQHWGFSLSCMKNAGLIMNRGDLLSPGPQAEKAPQPLNSRGDGGLRGPFPTPEVGDPGEGRDQGSYFDRFRQRIMFPIVTPQGKVIAFGGRTLGQDQPKYMNSPETPLFVKGQCLYRSLTMAPGRPVLVVEGYLDVISTSGFYGALAPLGTALTPEQLALIWKQCPEPVVCFDPDGAGQRASLKMAVMALPLLKPGYSLRFAQLPPDQDPHALVQTHGGAGLDKIVDQAVPMSEFLWRALFSPSLTPEGKAEAMERWEGWVNSIAHLQIRRLYKDFFYERGKKSQKSHIPLAPGLILHQKILLGMLVLHPFLMERVGESLCAMIFPVESSWLHVRNYLLSWKEGDSFSPLQQFLGQDWKEQIARVSCHIPSDTACLETHWKDLFNRYQTQLYQNEELLALKKDLMQVPGTWERLKNLTAF